MSRRTPQIDLARVYEAPAAAGRYRVLVDRLWPRGVRREDLALDEWLKEIAPSGELRRWFGHDVSRWDEFRDRYYAELRARPDLIEHLLGVAKKQGLLLLFAASDVEHNNAVALREFLLGHTPAASGKRQ